ncbi:hypothetical protein [Saccharibacillus alkalitolerans]|uniref:Amidase n=1 Tax=Saccharibacillus alkalitolerans TaxID=2705290 RepID=A0ABX0F9F6_9BACL|nr:hypothetical protein [Saccharibacillus alkalitolerans]NGZ77573.1 hypothetical protein [Saccharibacillus alkalitolerans]
MIKTRSKLSRCLILFLLLAWTAGSFGTSGAHAREQDGVSTWVWNPWLLRSSSDDLLRFAASNHVTTLYLQIDGDMAKSDYASFIGRASAQGIQVYALDGAPRWALDRSPSDAFIAWLSAYQSGAAANEKFAGIHVDVEPYLLPEWTSAREALLTSWKENVDSLIAGARTLGLTIEADIPFWFDEHVMPGETGTLSSWLIGRFDGITIMAYRDSAEQIAEVAKNELAEGEKLGKPIRIAVETNPSTETPQVTFYEEGASYLNSQLALVKQAVGGSSAFAGFAVHDYVGWKKLQDSEAAIVPAPLPTSGQTGSAVKTTKPTAVKAPAGKKQK